MEEEKEKKIEEQKISSEAMFSSWNAQLMEGVEDTSVNQDDSLDKKVQPTENKPVEPVILNNPVVDNKGESKKLEETDLNVESGNQPSISNFNGDEEVNSSNTESEKRDGTDENMAVVGLIFVVIIIFGIGTFVYNTFKKISLESEESNMTVNKEINKEDKSENNSTEKEVQGEMEVDNGEELENNSVHESELKRLCGLIDESGKYYSEMTGNVNDIINRIENARYCDDYVCMFTENEVVYSKNCKTGLENKKTIEEMKVSYTLENACITFNNTGVYNEAEFGITCENGRCQTIYNGRSFSQDCKKVK